MLSGSGTAIDPALGVPRREEEEAFTPVPCNVLQNLIDIDPGEVEKTGRFYGTDAGHLHYYGKMEGIVCGPGGRYNTMPDERVDIADFVDMIRIYMLAILEICG